MTIKAIQSHQDLLLPGAYTFLNPYSYLNFIKYKIDPNNFNGIGFDGISASQLVSITQGRRIRRTSFDFTSLAGPFFSHIQANHSPLAVIGTTPDRLEQAINTLKKQFPELNIAYQRHGYFRSQEEQSIVENDILEINPKYVLLGLGSGLQDITALKFRELLPSSCIITCGGFLHQISAGINYYPAFFNKTNTRFIYRIYDEPALLKRYFAMYPIGIWRLALDSSKWNILSNEI